LNTEKQRNRQINIDFVLQIASLEDAGVLLGTYQGRRKASKALDKIAYEPEPQW
jgi:hypothetical protein